MKKDYNYVQKKIDKLLRDTSEKHTDKTYHEMIKDSEYQLVIQKIGELMMELLVFKLTFFNKFFQLLRNIFMKIKYTF
jgi:hypothetical protein